MGRGRWKRWGRAAEDRRDVRNLESKIKMRMDIGSGTRQKAGKTKMVGIVARKREGIQRDEERTKTGEQE